MGERWGSLGDLTVSVASQAAAPARAHLRAIKSRQRGATEENSIDSDKPIRRDSKRVTLRTDKELFHVSFWFFRCILFSIMKHVVYSVALH